MNVQPYMIDVEYDETIERFDGTHAAIHQIAIADPLKRDVDKDGLDVWYTYNHFHRQIKRTSGLKRQMLQTGFRLEQTEQLDNETTEVYLIPLHDEVDPISLDYDEKHDIWFEKIKYRISTNEENNEQRLVRKQLNITGIVDAGTIKLVVKQNGTNVYEAYVHFLPSSLSKQDYDLMITDLFRINEKLFTRKSNVAVGNKKQYHIEQLEKIIAELEGPIYAINNQPQTELSFEWNKEKHNPRAKFRMRTEIEKRMHPGKHKVSVFTPYETTQIKENEMIKTELIRLKKYCDFHSEPDIIAADHEQLHHETDIALEKLSSNLKQKLTESGAITSGETIHLPKLKSYKQTLLGEQKNYDNEITRLITNEKQMIAQLNERINPYYQNAYVRVHFYLYSEQFKQNIVREQTVKSQYWGTKADNSMGFIGYEYIRGTQYFTRPNTYGKYLNVYMKTKQLTEHSKLANIFEQARIQLAEQPESGPIHITIEGNITYNTLNKNPDTDIIGVKLDQYKSEVRRYTFTFTNITGAKLNNRALDITTNIATMTEKIIPRIMSRDKKQQYSKLDTKQETTKHEIHLIENIIAMYEKQDEDDSNAKQYRAIGEKIHDWLQLPVFRTIQATGLNRLQPTQLFLHDPTYLNVWNLMNEIEESIDLSIIPEFGELRYGVKQVHVIYETWTLYKIIDLLTSEMGWTITDNTTAKQYLYNFITKSTKQNLDKFMIQLTQGKWKIDIYYEPTIKLVKRPDYVKKKNNEKQPTNYQPDYAFQFFHDEKPIGNAYIDAKLRNYLEQGIDKNNEPNFKIAEGIWKYDIDEIAIEKYGHINAVNEQWQRYTHTSFIVHPDITFGMKKELTGENYHVYYNDKLYPNMITGIQTDVHKYGSIYLTPSAVFPFKNWVRLMMEYHFEAYNHCWTCGSDNVEEETKFTISHFPKYYYTCQDCDSFWVKTHCSQAGHTIIKHANTYHKRADRTDRWHIVCPTCEDKFEDERQRFSRQTKGKITTHPNDNDTVFSEVQPEVIFINVDDLPY